jgi:hypothetical protein
MQARLVCLALWCAYQVLVALVTARSAEGATYALPAEGWESAPTEEAADLTAFWRWSPPAPHHQAMVRLQQGSASGSGVYVRLGQSAGILTAKHVVSEGGECRARWRDGRWSESSKILHDRDGHDVAFVFLRDLRRDVTPLTLIDRRPREGETLEVCGYGAATTRLRNYFVRQAGSFGDGVDRAVPGPIHGDSGGAILALDSGHRLAVASVVSAGSGQGLVGGERAYRQLVYPKPEHVVAFVRRVETQYGRRCPPGGCPPQGGEPDSELFPPDGGETWPGDDSWGRDGRELEPLPRGGEGTDPGVGLAIVAVAVAAAIALSLKRRLE